MSAPGITPAPWNPDAPVAVVIPALDEERSVGHVVHSLPVALVREVVVVDNGSRDGTAAVAVRAGATVLAEPRRGYGAACLRGLEYLRRRPPLAVAFLDADSSDDPAELPAVVGPILEGRADLVIGSRTTLALPGALSPVQRFGNRLATRLIAARFGARFTDLGPFRAARWNALESLGMRDRDYGWTVEMQVKAAKRRLRCLEVAVSYRPRVGSSKVSGTLRGVWGAGTKILWVIARESVAR
jgi:glycosyltransferase involved in cell wall biosynthesis